MNFLKFKIHPYELRLRIRRNLPWFLFNLGLVSKGRDCTLVGAEHHWYNTDGKNSACYYCRVIEVGQLWNKQDTQNNMTADEIEGIMQQLESSKNDLILTKL